MIFYVIYASIVVFLFAIIYGAWSRKAIYKEVDRLENRKIQLMNEPVTEELSKIKSLKMSGETEERFEQWRKEWDEIVTVQLPDIEEKLFDIEESANKYRFNKGRRIARFVDEELNNLDTHLKEMFADVEQLVDSEEQNRQDIHNVKDLYQETKKKMWAQRGILGTAGANAEKRIQDLQELFTTFEEETEQGNYLQAREILLQLKEEIGFINEAMEKAPEFLVLLQRELPAQLQELERGFEEMEKEGYVLEHFSVKWQTEELKKQIGTLLPLAEALKLNEVAEPVESIQKNINEIYEKLEYEALSKQYSEKELPVLEQKLVAMSEQYEALIKEIETLKLSYRLTEEDDDNLLKTEKQFKALVNQYTVIKASAEEKKQSFTAIRKLIEEFNGKLAEAEKDMADRKEHLNHLRSDERDAGETIRQLRETLLSGRKKLNKSNLPGVPSELLGELEEAGKAVEEAAKKLNELPLSMDEIRMKVEEATNHVESCTELLNKTIEEASLAEQVIQFGNRYRNKYDELNIKLLQAESCFRQYQYEEALQTALKAVEKVEPNVLEKVSANRELLTV
ncbi:septation ring formation regulator EzrA [Evansella sp. LMS18]|uniref:septation ring formation regulator EzrA n=1 Tax=Evansella sp. LMS18 TaxID=2924033 RepID=UPI0020D1AADC|nr:septation ring formation regulator EzrA [Evansella sp. LMS18]UTR11401.1 septation ring formation regulator EzrA [Evansella sp. LMS18]